MKLFFAYLRQRWKVLLGAVLPDAAPAQPDRMPVVRRVAMVAAISFFMLGISFVMLRFTAGVRSVPSL